MPERTRCKGFDKSIFDKLKGRKIALFLDYDGTLCAIRKDPSKCLLPENMKRLLKSLAGSNSVYPVIISGRARKVVERLAGVKDICYCGSHGLDISAPEFSFLHPKASSAKAALKEIKNLLVKRASGFKGVLIEDKTYSMTLHYRALDPAKIKDVAKFFFDVAGPYLKEKKLALLEGKMVLELIPFTSWNKGMASLLILEALGRDYAPVYIGDDLTDEYAFKELRSSGITIKVGQPGSTYAAYYVKEQKKVIDLLGAIRAVSGVASRQ